MNIAINDPSAAERVLGAVPAGMLIGGDWVQAASGRRLAVEDPASGRTLGEVPDAGPEDARRAIDAAARAQPAWANLAPRARSEILRRTFDLMTARADDLALLMTLENGKPLAEARGEVAYAAEFFRWFSEEAVRIDGRWTVAPNGVGRLVVMHQPVGPALLVTPWNFPAAMATRKIAPAIAAGCTSILKPAEETPFTAFAVAAILLEAGLPPGVLNVVTTSEPGPLVSAIMADSRLRKVSFTGSTEVGRILIRASADNVLRTSMELGGNAPFLIFDDADMDAVLEGAMIAKMRNVGQVCVAANRFYVARSRSEEFAEGLAGRMGSLRIGHGTDPQTQVGPLISEAGRAKVTELVRDMTDRGGRIVVGGERVDGPGYYYRPTVVTGVPEGSRALAEEIFGPVAPIVGFDSEESAVEWANRSRHGLMAYVYTRDVGRAMRVAEALESGMVGVNTGFASNPAAPWGGVKQSGLGREGGHEGIHEFLEAKYVALNW
jgi:succinate-semialdehyde dehydrogenase/glutarate-semialdehyde dehydrogenase